VAVVLFLSRATLGAEVKKGIEAFISEWDDRWDIDSLAVWSNASQDRPWLFATSKKKHKVLIYNSATGQRLTEFGSRGKKLGEFDRPNGIAVGGNFLFVVERNNHRVQVFSLPELIPLTTFGEKDLQYPYGITLVAQSEARFTAYVTDNDEEKGGQVHQYVFEGKSRKPHARLVRIFGDFEGKGMLKKVESIYVDSDFNQLLVADEESRDIKVYQLDGKFSGQTIGKGIFQSEPEGLVLYQCGRSEGYWILTDQNSPAELNLFHIFKRGSFEYLGGFFGENTSNTDGIALTQVSYSDFAHGSLFAVNNDGGVNAFSLDSILPSVCPF
jgi:3-phytase